MTQSAFDPACLSSYPASDPPKFLHFEWEGSSDIHRYMLVDKFHVNDIDPATRRCRGEGTDRQLQMKYINPAVELDNVDVPAVKVDTSGIEVNYEGQTGAGTERSARDANDTDAGNEAESGKPELPSTSEAEQEETQDGPTQAEPAAEATTQPGS